MRDIDFCRKFTLDRQRLSGMLIAIAQNDQATDEQIANAMGVNPYMVTGFRGWLRKTGLGTGTSGKYKLTPLGRNIAKYDPKLHLTGTLWLLHYNLCSEHEERAEVWFRCFNEFISVGQTFEPEMLRAYVERSVVDTVTNVKGIANDTNELITTYTQPNALGGLNIITKHKKMIEVTPSQLPHPLIAAYILFDSWPRRFGAADSVRLSQVVTEPECLGRICMATPERTREMILTLQGLGLVNYADTQHEPVTRRFHGPALELIERYYEEQ